MFLRQRFGFSLAILFLFAGVFSGCSLAKNSSEVDQTNTSSAAVPEQALAVTLTINDATYPASIAAGSNALDLLQEVTAEQNIVLQTKAYSFGTSVETIGEQTNGQDKKYWIYYVNDSAGTTSLDGYKLQNGDKVRLSFEAPK